MDIRNVTHEQRDLLLLILEREINALKFRTRYENLSSHTMLDRRSLEELMEQVTLAS